MENPLDTLGVIDADGHLLEPPDLWQRRLPHALRERGPRLVRNEDTQVRLAMDGRIYPKHQGLGRGFFGLAGYYKVDHAGRASALEIILPQSHLASMDKDGIQQAIAFPTLGLYAVTCDEPELAQAICRAYNDWLAEEYVPTDPARLLGAAMISLTDPQAAAAELRRCVQDLGFKVAFLRPNPVHGRPLDDAGHDVFWATAQELNVPVGLHEGTDGQVQTAGLDRYTAFFFSHMASHPFEQMLAMAGMIAGGLLERFPRLRIAFLESGCGWLPYWLDRLDEHFEKLPQEVPQLTMKPSEYFERQCVISCDPDEKEIGHVVSRFGENKVLFASDYPHWDALPAGCIVSPLRGKEDLAPSARRAILRETAVNFFQL